MATISTARSSYQQTDHITLGGRKPFASDPTRALLNQISLEATRMTAATTQQAYLMRLTNLRSLMRQLQA